MWRQTHDWTDTWTGGERVEGNEESKEVTEGQRRSKWHSYSHEERKTIVLSGSVRPSVNHIAEDNVWELLKTSRYKLRLMLLVQHITCRLKMSLFKCIKQKKSAFSFRVWHSAYMYQHALCLRLSMESLWACLPDWWCNLLITSVNWKKVFLEFYWSLRLYLMIVVIIIMSSLDYFFQFTHLLFSLYNPSHRKFREPTVKL